MNKISTPATSSVSSEGGFVPVSLNSPGIVHGSRPAHPRPFLLWSSQARQWHFPFLSVSPANKHSFLKAFALRALPIARPVPSPNCPLTPVCKLTFGTRPRDAEITLRGAAAADGRGKLSHSEVHCFISGCRPCPGNGRHTL